MSFVRAQCPSVLVNDRQSISAFVLVLMAASVLVSVCERFNSSVIVQGW